MFDRFRQIVLILGHHRTNKSSALSNRALKKRADCLFIWDKTVECRIYQEKEAVFANVRSTGKYLLADEHANMFENGRFRICFKRVRPLKGVRTGWTGFCD